MHHAKEQAVPRLHKKQCLLQHHLTDTLTNSLVQVGPEPPLQESERIMVLTETVTPPTCRQGSSSPQHLSVEHLAHPLLVDHKH